MSQRLRRLLVVSIIAALCAFAVLSLSGCCPFLQMPVRNEITGPTENSNGVDGLEEDNAADDIQEDEVQPESDKPLTDEVVIVPDVLGAYYDDAAAKIEAAGLVPVEASIHGPLDEDAGEIGKIYRQTPAAGTSVAPGSKVELRYWWESQ